MTDHHLENIFLVAGNNIILTYTLICTRKRVCVYVHVYLLGIIAIRIKVFVFIIMFEFFYGFHSNTGHNNF